MSDPLGSCQLLQNNFDLGMEAAVQDSVNGVGTFSCLGVGILHMLRT